MIEYFNTVYADVEPFTMFVAAVVVWFLADLCGTVTQVVFNLLKTIIKKYFNKKGDNDNEKVY